MSGEIKAAPSGYTVDTAIEMLLGKMDERDRLYQQQFQAAKEAVQKAEVATEKRFESVNEFRQTLTDQTNSFLPRAEYDVQHQALEDKVQIVTDWMTGQQGMKTGQQLSKKELLATISGVAALLGMVSVIANAVFR